MSRRDPIRDLRSDRELNARSPPPADYSDEEYEKRSEYSNRGRDSPHDKVGRYRGNRASGGANAAASGLAVNLNVEQMVSMVFEMRGSLAHEIEARRATEIALQDARQQIENLKDTSQRDNNKWSNLLGRVKELEVGSRLDNRLGEMNTRAVQYARNNDQQKLVTVFQDIKQRLDGQERDIRDGLTKLSRDSVRDQQRAVQDLRAWVEQNLLKVDGLHQNEADATNRLQNRITDLEKEFAVFMNAQVMLQQNLNNKEKDGDWLKIYLTENFNAQKHETENKFHDVENSMDKMNTATRHDYSKLMETIEKMRADFDGQLEAERQARDSANKKLHKLLKQSVSGLSENITKAIGVLDSKMLSIKSTQNEAISNLHAIVSSEQSRMEGHLAAFADMVNIQTEQSQKEHALSTRLDSLEEVLKAEIKSRLKNHQKSKLATLNVQKNFEKSFDEYKAFQIAKEDERRRMDAIAHAEEEEHARLLHIAMESRACLDSMVSQVEEQHYVELRKNEWKAFGQVIEQELKSRDERVEMKFSSFANSDLISHKVSEVKSYVELAFKEYEQAEAHRKREEEEAAQLMNIAMESRAVLDSMITHIVDKEESYTLQLLSENMRTLDARSRACTDQIANIKSIVEAEHDATSNQLIQTHGEIMNMASELAEKVDAHSAQLEALAGATDNVVKEMHEGEDLSSKSLGQLKAAVADLTELSEVHRKETTSFRTRFDELQDVQEGQTKDIKNLKNAVGEVQDTVSSHNAQLKTLAAGLMDATILSQNQKNELEHKLQVKTNETAAAVSSTGAKLDELSGIVRRLDAVDRTTAELHSTTDSLGAKTVKLEQAIQGLHNAMDDSNVSQDKKLKEIRDKIEIQFEDSDAALKKLDKRFQGHLEEFDKLAGDFAARSGGLSSSSKLAEENLADLRKQLTSLTGVGEKVESIRAEIKDLHSQLSTTVDVEKYNRDVTNLQSNFRSQAEMSIKDIKQLRESIASLDEHTNKQHKDSFARMLEMETKIQHLGNNQEAGEKDKKRVVDASIVEKEVQGVEKELEALSKRVKETANQTEDAINRVSQDLKKLTIKVESIEHAGPSNAGADDQTKKGLNDLGFRVDALEQEVKVKTVAGLTHQITDLAAKTDSRFTAVDTRFTTTEGRLEKVDAEMKRIAEASDESDQKQNKRLKDLQTSIDEQATRDLENQNALKAEVGRQAIETDKLIKESEGRTGSTIKNLQKQVDQQEADLKAHVRSVDSKLHEMEWSLEYAKDASFKKDAGEIRAQAAAAASP